MGQCKSHGELVTKTSIHIIQDFTLENLQIETSYLKNTIAPNLEIKYRSDADTVTKKYKMINGSAEQLKKNINPFLTNAPLL